MTNLAINRGGIIMAGGLAHRVSPGAWRETKGLWSMVGKRMITRVITELYKPNSLNDILITTCLFADKFDVYVQENQKRFEDDKLSVATFLPDKKDINTERFLNTVNTSHSVLLGYKAKHKIENMGELVNLPDISYVEELASPATIAIHKKITKGTATKEEKERLESLQKAAGRAIANDLKPLPPHEHPPFVVTGCDALSTGDLRSMYDSYLQQSDALGVIKIKSYLPEALELVKNYGIVKIKDIQNGKEKDLVKIMEFVEKSKDPDQQYIRRDRLYLVNPQLYCFNPAVLALVELFAKYGARQSNVISPDWGRDILPILAHSGKLLGDIMREDEYWVDIGDYGSFLLGALDILHRRVPDIISIPGKEEKDGWFNKVKLPKSLGDPQIHGPIYAGPGSIINSTALIKESIIERDAIISGMVENSVIFEGAEIPRSAIIKNCIIGKNVKLPEKEIDLENQVIEIVYDRVGKNYVPILLTSDIPFVRDPISGELSLDTQGRPMPKNQALEMPRRRFFPNK